MRSFIVAQVLGVYLTGIGDTRATFHAQMYGALSSLVVGLPLACIWGAAGACAGMLVVNVAKSVASAIYAHRHREIDEEIHHEVELQVSA